MSFLLLISGAEPERLLADAPLDDVLEARRTRRRR